MGCFDAASTWCRPKGGFCSRAFSEARCARILWERPLQKPAFSTLAQTFFDSIADVQAAAARWRWTYNNERPSMALGGYHTGHEAGPRYIAPLLAPTTSGGITLLSTVLF